MRAKRSLAIWAAVPGVRMKNQDMGPKTMSVTLRWPRSPWQVAAPIAYVLGAAISFGWAIVALDEGTTSQELISLLTVFLVIGIFLAGVGQLMRAAAHGTVSRAGKTVDGWGKVIGLLGWSFGLVGAVLFAMDGTEAPEWLMAVSVIAVLAVPVLAFLVSLVSIGSGANNNVSASDSSDSVDCGQRAADAGKLSNIP